MSAIPKTATANSDYLYSLDWKKAVSGMTARDAAINLYSGYCLQGIMAMPASSGTIKTSEWNGFFTVATPTYNILIWSIKEECT